MTIGAFESFGQNLKRTFAVKSAIAKNLGGPERDLRIFVIEAPVKVGLDDVPLGELVPIISELNNQGFAKARRFSRVGHDAENRWESSVADMGKNGNRNVRDGICELTCEDWNGGFRERTENVECRKSVSPSPLVAEDYEVIGGLAQFSRELAAEPGQVRLPGTVLVLNPL